MRCMDTRSFHRERSARAVLYVLHSGALFGTERMAIATLRALGPDCDSLLLAPPGAALAFARAAGLRAAAFGGVPGLCARMAGFMRGRREVALLATGVSQSLAGIAVAAATGTRLRHLHLVHGGTDERLSYGRKKWLRAFCVDFVAVSDFVRGRLTAHGVPGSRIEVIENFLSAGERPRRAPFAAPVARAVVVSRLDPIKRVDVLLDALGSDARLRGLPVDVLGTGWQAARLRSEAEVGGLAVSFQGFCEDVPGWLARSDLLVHTCPEEPFGGVGAGSGRAGGVCARGRDGVCLPRQ